MNEVFIKRKVLVEKPADRVVFFLGRLCIEDFMEILLLCGNGYGIGGMKILRGMYERAVNLGFIAKHHDEADTFLNYHHIHAGKRFNHAKKVFPMERILPHEIINEIMDSYKKTKEDYKETVCKKCGTTRTRFSWSELDLASMAREAELDKLYLQCYYDPTLQAHATVSSLIARMRIREGGQVSFNESMQREKADSTMISAHNLILYILKKENDYFKMKLDDEIQECFSDFQLIWKRDKV